MHYRAKSCVTRYPDFERLDPDAEGPKRLLARTAHSARNGDYGKTHT